MSRMLRSHAPAHAHFPADSHVHPHHSSLRHFLIRFLQGGVAACLAVLLTSLPTRARDIEVNAGWSTEFSRPGIDGDVYASIEYRGDLIVAGSFDLPGNPPIHNIARWDGGAWQPLGDGLNGDNFGDEVRALAIYKGDLIAGGNFGPSADARAMSLARWDGAIWQPLGGGLQLEWRDPLYRQPQVKDLRVLAGRLIVAGAFDSAGSVAFRNIAAWDGSRWSALGRGVNSIVYRMFDYRGDLIVSGRFSEAGGVPSGLLARWDGKQWHSMADGNWAQAFDFSVIKGKLLMSGRFRKELGAPADYLAMWDGSAWREFPVPLLPVELDRVPGGVKSVALFRNELVVGGIFSLDGTTVEHLARWTGEKWTVLGDNHQLYCAGGFFNQISMLGFHDGDLLVAGCFDEMEGVPVNGLARWDGTRWHAYGSGGGLTDPVTDLVIWNDGLVASSSRVVVWDGNSLTYLPHPFASPAYALLSQESTLLASGGHNPETWGLYRWDGTSWTREGTGFLAWDLIEWNGKLVAAGEFPEDPVDVTSVAEWDGSSWRRLGTPLAGRIQGLTVFRGNLTACETSATVADGARVLQWSGTRWNPIGTTSPHAHFVFDLAVFRDDLVAVGHFTEIDDVPAANVARWDGHEWHALGAGLEKPDAFAVGYAAQELGNCLVVGGAFASADGVAASNIAAWNDSGWTPLGPGIDGAVWTLTAAGDDLYAGGNFRLAGGNPSYYLARWSAGSQGNEGSLQASPISFEPPLPNPFSGTVVLSYTLAARGETHVRVFDVTGRLLNDLVDRVQSAGDHSVSWNGRRSDGSEVPAGMYFIHVDQGSQKLTRRVVCFRK